MKIHSLNLIFATEDALLTPVPVNQAQVREVTLAEVNLNDGQRMLA